MMLHQLDAACRAYAVEYGTLPMEFSDLTNNPRGILFFDAGDRGISDGWGFPIVYEPFNATRGYARLLSFGKDGKPGGKAANADMEVRIEMQKQQDTNQASDRTR